MRALSIKSGDAFILVYSAAEPETFEEAKVIRDQILEIKGGSDVPIVIVGNKTDLICEKDQEVVKLHILYLYAVNTLNIKYYKAKLLFLCINPLLSINIVNVFQFLLL